MSGRWPPSKIYLKNKCVSPLGPKGVPGASPPGKGETSGSGETPCSLLFSRTEWTRAGSCFGVRTRKGDRVASSGPKRSAQETARGPRSDVTDCRCADDLSGEADADSVSLPARYSIFAVASTRSLQIRALTGTFIMATVGLGSCFGCRRNRSPFFVLEPVRPPRRHSCSKPLGLLYL
jgi:hypothetical protein